MLWNPALKQTRYDFRPIRERANVEWVERDIRPLHLDSLLKTGSWLRSVRPDVYVSPFYALPLAASCPCVVTLHDVWPQRLATALSPAKRWLHRLLVNRAAGAAAVVTSSEFSRREITELTRIAPRRLHVVRLGTPYSASAPEPSRPEGMSEAPFALLVGVNLPHKNLGTVARLWSGADPPSGLDLVWAGRRDPRHPSLAELAGPDSSSRVKALGWVDPAGLEWLYRNATMLLFPSRYEGFGFPLLEAFSKGLPVIASDIPVLREVGEGVASFCDPDDSAAWAAEIRALAGDPSRREGMRALGRGRAAEYTYERTADETVKILREVALRR